MGRQPRIELRGTAHQGILIRLPPGVHDGDGEMRKQWEVELSVMMALPFAIGGLWDAGGATHARGAIAGKGREDRRCNVSDWNG